MASKAASIARATGTEWSEWEAWLSGRGARDLPHAEIAKLALGRVHDLGITTHAETGKPFNDGWWAQAIAIEFGRQHGLREKGQRSTGEHSVSVTKKVPGTPEALIERWVVLVADLDDFDGVRLADAPRRSATDKRSYWRVSLADGSRVAVAASTDQLAVEHSRLTSAEVIERWRPVWRSLLASLA